MEFVFEVLLLLVAGVITYTLLWIGTNVEGLRKTADSINKNLAEILENQKKPQ